MRLLLKYFYLLLLLQSLACSINNLSTKLDDAELSKIKLTSYELTSVPFFPQERYQCGPASLATLLAWNGEQVTPVQLKPLVYSPKKQGSLQASIVSAARRKGFLAYEIRPNPVDAFREVSGGNPVLIMQNLGLSWFPKWHFSVLVGYDIEEDIVILRSGTERRQILSLRTFLNTWGRSQNWGIIVLSPGEFPVAADSMKYLKSVSGLEHAGKLDEAFYSYKKAATRWPQNLIPVIGMANIHLKRGELEEAKYILEDQLNNYPRSPILLNNYANVLASLGLKKEALRAAREAMKYEEGPYKDSVQRTFEELKFLVNFNSFQ